MSRPVTDPVGLSWLVTVRWTAIAAGLGALAAGRGGLGASAPLASGLVALAAMAVTNLWVAWQLRLRRTPSRGAAGLLVSFDVLALSYLLRGAGGVLNPVSIFYLVDIVLAALVLGRTWTWIIVALSIAGYGAMFLVSSEELRMAATMHPEIGMHVRGMWVAFAATALLVGLLVARLATAVARRDEALEAMQEAASRAARLAGLSTLAAGATHELSTPLATIAVAAREMERAIESRGGDAGTLEDARLIRQATDRCREILDNLSGRTAEQTGEAPHTITLADVAAAVLARLRPADRDRVNVAADNDVVVRWPPMAIARALTNLVVNALHASAPASSITLALSARPMGTIELRVADTGRGMTAEELGRAGEPFFTTKPQGVGTGLGLFVTRATIEQLGGHMHVASTAGQGTTVTIDLPVDALHQAFTSDDLSPPVAPR